MPRRNSTTSPDDVEAAVYRKHRKCTDVAALVIMALYMIGLFSLVFLCLAKSDPFRIINGYDDCGNVCGRSNNPINGLACSGQNMLAYKYLLLERVPNSTETTKSCVEKCPTNYGYKLNYNRCVRFQQERPVSDQVTQNVFDEIWQDVYNCGVELFWLCLLCLFLSLLTLALLWGVPGLMLSWMLIAIVVLCLIATAARWISWMMESEAHSKKSYLIYAILTTVLSITILCLFGCVWKKTPLVIELLKESGNAIRRTLFLLVCPMLTTIVLLMTFTLDIYFFLVIESSGNPIMVAGNRIVYEKNLLVHTTRWYNIIALIWFSYFLVDGQHMVTAGAISSWYFTRKKSGLGNAEGRSFLKLLKYHLGSVALGSLMFSVTLPIRFIIKSFELILNQISNGLAAYCSNFSIGCRIYYGWCLELIQRIAYVVVALQGLPFFKAGKSAVMIMMASATNFVVVHSVANIIFLLLKLFIVGLVGSIGVEILQKKCDLYHPYFLAGIFGVAVVTITHCFISVYEMTNTTVLLCFCKDIRENNGTDRPYYMSRNLRKFLPNEHNETYRARTIR